MGQLVLSRDAHWVRKGGGAGGDDGAGVAQDCRVAMTLRLSLDACMMEA